MSELIVKIKSRKLIIRWFMLIPLILSGFWFYLLEKKILIPEYFLHIRLDDFIPHIPLFVIPYVFWYIYVIVPAVFLFFKAPDEFFKIAVFLTMGMLIACTIYTLFPNGQTLRPELSGSYNGLLIRWINIIYSNDSPNNCAPSIHVIYSVAAHAGIALYNNNRKKILWVNIVSLITAILCILSTVFIKQHSVIDLFLGLIVSFLLYFIIYGKGIKKYTEQQI